MPLTTWANSSASERCISSWGLLVSARTAARVPRLPNPAITDPLLATLATASTEGRRNAMRALEGSPEPARVRPALVSAFEAAPEPKEFVMLDGNAHAQHIFRTDRGEELTETILEWLARAP